MQPKDPVGNEEDMGGISVNFLWKPRERTVAGW